nr:hypothetical protein [Hoyosella altamirensis]
MTDFHRDPTRPWLILLKDERAPAILGAAFPNLVSWSSIWPRRPDIHIRFDIVDDHHGGSDVRWTLLASDGMVYDASAIGHMCKRLNELINKDLRYTFGQ